MNYADCLNHMDIWGKDRCSGTFVAVLLIVLGCLAATQYAHAEGSRSLYPITYPSNGARANLDLQPPQKFVGKVLRRTFLYVYAQAGEYILLGSSNRNSGGNIFVYNPQNFGIPGDETVPNVADFDCSSNSPPVGGFGGTGKGAVTSRAQELAGPNSADNSATVTNGFAPCAYRAPSSGIYGVRFTAATGGGNPNGSVASPTASAGGPPPPLHRRPSHRPA